MPPRRVRLSHKQKAEQLKARRQAQQDKQSEPGGGSKASVPPSEEARLDPSHFFLRFINDSDATVARHKETAYEPFDFEHPMFQLEQQVYISPENCPDLPRRPPGVRSMTREQLEEAERAVFDAYFRGISPCLDSVAVEYCTFECNPNVYRHVWRVTERSQVMCIVADARFPLAHMPVSILRYAYANNRPVIIVLSKADLVSADDVAAWMEFFKKYTTSVLGEDRAVILACSPKELKEDGDARQRFLEEFITAARRLGGISAPELITVGFFGQPSVGKSSLMNGLYGKKIVSVKLTPGHTKHLQTYYMMLEGIVSGETNRSFMLCDCPGLVFPVRGSPRPLQVITGVFPLARVREYVSPLRTLVEHFPTVREALDDRLKLTMLWNRYPEIDERLPQSPGDYLDLFGYLWGYFVKGNTPNMHKAGLDLFRLVVEGSISYSLKPAENLEFNLEHCRDNIPQPYADSDDNVHHDEEEGADDIDGSEGSEPSVEECNE
ncbi:GTP-binding protein [Giardia muris]|uniref:Guanine nucleotide-binding protein-like 1 n=1 Tax=Giardia muris TaxID=5742 RepID=A0A4Z1T8H8_GIAMU|nr:GTP-binding protein [Giardia muris]|eukprot:TNJ29437.1 GTP-binding protein [Giardia muris]